jgi:hypothetical protein
VKETNKVPGLAINKRMRVWFGIILPVILSTATALASGPSTPGAGSPHPTVISGLNDEEFDLLYEDRYFYVDNKGLTRVHVILNGRRFKLATDPNEVRQGSNTYLMPSDGEIVIDLFQYMKRDGNRMWIHGEGPAGTEATVLVGDQVYGGTVHYILRIEPLPVDISLSQNYPNPFNRSTKILYDIPDGLMAGEHVMLAIYSSNGERVRVLVDERRFPGSFTAEWNGLDDQGREVSSGMYLYKITAGYYQSSRRLLLLK